MRFCVSSKRFASDARFAPGSGALIGAGLTAALLASVPGAWAEDASKDHARMETPSSFQGPTVPAKAPKNIKVGIIPCGAAFHGCTAPADAAAEAAKKLGWTVTMYDGGADQQKQNAAILDAISAGSNLILTSSLDPNFIQLGLSAAKKANIPVISASEGTDTPNPVVRAAGENLKYVLDVGTNFPQVGEHVAEWIAADSGGKANVVVFTDEEFYSVTSTIDGLLAGLKKCSGCVVQPVQKITASQVATTVGQQTVGYLQSHPDVTYVYAPYDPAAAFMVNAIAQAGLADRVKLASIVGDAHNLEFIRQGRVEVVDGAFDNTYMGYAMVDQAIRVLNGQKVIEPNDEGTPFRVMDQTNLPPSGADWGTKSDFKGAYLKLWQ
jgi:ribose transport system substrate-binding protein